MQARSQSGQTTDEKATPSKPFTYIIDEFADIKVMRYRFEAWQNLSLNQKHLIYHLSCAALWGRDIIWQQHCELNLVVRKALEKALTSYQGSRTTADWKEFETYCKRVFFSNGIHHHYAEEKFFPLCSREYFISVVASSFGKDKPHTYSEQIAEYVYNHKISSIRS